jgi:surface antigen
MRLSGLLFAVFALGSLGLAGCSSVDSPGAPPAAAATPAQPSVSAVPAGVALGGVLGGPVGAGLADGDREAAFEAQVDALDSGQRRSWRGAHGVFGFVEPGAATGDGCRAYSQTIYVAGRANRGRGVACKQPDGSWKMTS